MTQQHGGYDVFLSYSRSDRSLVEDLAHALRRRGVTPFLDLWDLVPGEPWQPSLEEALQTSRSCAVCIGPDGPGQWQLEEMRVAIDRRVSQGSDSFRVIPVLLPGGARGERGRLPSFLAATTWVEFTTTLDDGRALDELIGGIRGLAPGPRQPEAAGLDTCPYRGLEYFDVEHASFYFGRDALTEWLLYYLRGENRFLAMIGPSGSGKSSLARAGLLAAFAKGKLPGSASWPVAVVRPGSDPLESLALALARTGLVKGSSAVNGLIHDLARAGSTLHQTLGSVVDGDEGRVVLLIDQLEEVFTLCEDADRRRALFDNLVYAAGREHGSTLVLLALRSDFYGECAAYPSLAALLSDHQVLVAAMTDEELRSAINGPASRVGCELQEGLAEQLVRDVSGQPGGLPLLQHTLLELWRQRRGRWLTWEAYRALGGVEGAVQRRAEEVYQGFGDAEQRACRRLFLRLTEAAEEARRTIRVRAPQRELVGAERDPAAASAVIETMTRWDTRLLTVEADTSTRSERDALVEIAHDALIHGWGRLRGWLEEDHAFLLWRQRLNASMQDWKDLREDHDALLRGARLIEAQRWLETRSEDVNQTERQYIEASTTWQRDQDEKWKRLAEENERRRLEAEHQRRVAIDHQLAANLREQATEVEGLLRVDPLRGLVMAIHAMGLNLTRLPDQRISAVQRCLSSAIQLARERNALHGHASTVRAVAWSPDGDLLVSGGDDRTLRLWDRQGRPVGEPLVGHEDFVAAVAWSPDGDLLVSGGGDRTLRLWDRQGRPAGPSWRAHRYFVAAVAWSPDGELMVSCSADREVKFWDRGGNAFATPLLGHEAPVVSVAFSPDGAAVASGSADRTLRLWDRRGRSVGGPLRGHELAVHSVAFSAQGELLASASADGTVRLWNRRGRQVAVCRGHGGPVLAVAASPVDQVFASAGADHAVRLWDRHGDAVGRPFLGHREKVNAVAFHPDGKHLVSASDDGTVRVWDLGGTRLGRIYEGHDNPVLAVAFGPDGTRMLSGSADGQLYIWNWRRTTSGELLQGTDNPVLAVAFSPDGVSLSAGGDGKLRLWGPDGALMEQFQAHDDAVEAVAFSPKGEAIVSGGRDDTLRLWDRQGNPWSPAITAHKGGMLSASISQDGRLIATGGVDSTVRLWHGPEWMTSLRVGCERLRNHSVLANPADEAAKDACWTCRRYAWDER